MAYDVIVVGARVAGAATALLLARLDAAGTPATRQVRLDLDGVVLAGRFPPHGGADALYSPRRTGLDSLLARAAREAGAEVREGFAVDELRWSEGRVVGIAGEWTGVCRGPAARGPDRAAALSRRRSGPAAVAGDLTAGGVLCWGHVSKHHRVAWAQPAGDGRRG